MSTTSALLILCLVSSSYQDELENCFNDTALMKTYEKHLERFAPLEEQCKKDAQEDPDECEWKKLSSILDAHKECKSENKEATTVETDICICKKLKVEVPSKEELSFENFKKERMEIVLKSKAKYVEETLDSCKDAKDYYRCTMDKLEEKCEDVKMEKESREEE